MDAALPAVKQTSACNEAPAVQSADVQMAPPLGLHPYSTHRPSPAQCRREQHVRAGTIVLPAPAPVEQVHTSKAPTCEPKGKQREEPVFIPKGMLFFFKVLYPGAR